MSPFGVQNHLAVVICKDADEAIAKGYDYKGKNIKPMEIEKAVVVQNGTRAGNPTVDLLMTDQDGNKYVLLITGALLKSIPL